MAIYTLHLRTNWVNNTCSVSFVTKLNKRWLNLILLSHSCLFEDYDLVVGETQLLFVHGIMTACIIKCCIFVRFLVFYFSLRVRINALTYLRRGVWMLNCIVICLWSTISNEETFLQDFLLILKHSLQNYLKILKKCFFAAICIVIYLICSYPLPHTGMLPVAKEFDYNFYVSNNTLIDVRCDMLMNPQWAFHSKLFEILKHMVKANIVHHRESEISLNSFEILERVLSNMWRISFINVYFI